MEQMQIDDLGDALYLAMQERRMLSPLTETYPELTIEDAYAISLRFLANRMQAGEKLIGKKIGVTSDAVMDMLGVRQPDFGFMTDAMRHDEEMAISGALIQPRAEGEIAFLLNKDLQGPGVTNDDVLAATEAVMPCFEVVDSRVKDWQIKIQDTIADNASCGWFALNEAAAVDPAAVDLVNCEVHRRHTEGTNCCGRQVDHDDAQVIEFLRMSGMGVGGCRIKRDANVILYDML